MDDWRQAFRLAKFELGASKWSLLYLFLFLLLVLRFHTSVLHSDIETKAAGFDLAFMLTFTPLFMIWLKPKDFQPCKVSGKLIASPSLIMHTRLAIKKDVIVKSNLIINFVHSFPFQLAFLICLYPLTPALQEILSIPSYIAFSIIWLSFNVYAGYLFLQTDTGAKLHRNIAAITFGIIAGVITAMVLISFVFLATGNSIFYWTIIFADKWPLISSISSIILAIIGAFYWHHHGRNKLDKLDHQ